jgi:uncharacterized protein (DUF362 family)
MQKLFKPNILKKVVYQDYAHHRPLPIQKQSARPTVFSIPTQDLSVFIKQLDSVWDKVWPDAGNTNLKILIKINLNTADPYPASTDPEFLRYITKFLIQKGYSRIMIGDCSAIGSLPTLRILKRTGIWDAIQDKVEIHCFDRESWVRVQIDGQFLKEITLPRLVFDVDRIISIANCKAHRLAGFSMGMKLGVGFMHPLERYALHDNHLSEKIAEINLAAYPDLTIIDGRKAMISGGPVQGRIEEGNQFLVGNNVLAVDLEGYRLLYQLKKYYSCIENFSEDPFGMIQFKHGRDIGLGGIPWNGYDVVQIL